MPRTLLPIKNFETAVHPTAPSGDARERAVACWCRRETWNICGCCNAHCAHHDSVAPSVPSPSAPVE
jgi:hypothetical protein